jgi:hypothetical protein
MEQRLLPYINQVYLLSKGNLDGRNVNINFVSDKSNVLGTCYWWRNEITISEYHWKRLDYYGKISLIAHELGHCKKQLEHINGTKWGCAEHFMHYKETGFWCNRKYFVKYLKQMKDV